MMIIFYKPQDRIFITIENNRIYVAINYYSMYFFIFVNFTFPESRETAYIYAISSAGVMYSVTRACAQGSLVGCGCDDSVRKKDTHGKFEWGGCSENLQYGSKFAEEFVDVKEQDVNEVGLMNLWNNKAGRLVSFGTFIRHIRLSLKNVG